MALFNKWWILCAVSLSCFARFGSCRQHGQDGAQSEPLIFDELCALKDEPGPCKAIKERFFFNVDTGLCELFEYGGCGGNANNFLTLDDCEDKCVVSDSKNPCHLPEAPGPCRGLITRYFFDTVSQQCKHFFYGGCFGNANNFRSMADCHAKCQNPVVPTKAPEVHIHSDLLVQPNIEATSEQLTAGEPETSRNETNQELKDVEDVTKASHGNNAGTEVIPPSVRINNPDPTSDGYRDMKPTNHCSQPVERGDCDGAVKRFAYSPQSKRCHMFRYTGCGGNENNFTSRKDCSITCTRRRKGHGRKMIRIRKKNLDIIHRSA